MRRRHQAVPRLESMEERLVLSTTTSSLTSSAVAELSRLGTHLHQGWTSIEHYITGLSQQSQASRAAASRWAIHARHVHKSSGDLFGIPGFKL